MQVDDKSKRWLITVALMAASTSTEGGEDPAFQYLTNVADGT